MTKSAAILIIGNEILNGSVQDTNSAYLASELRALGVDVRRISVVPDVIDDIAAEVRSCAGRFDFVFTSGGVGPTHDDVTMAAVASAFDLRTVANPALLEVIRLICGGDAEGAGARMAQLPDGAELIGEGGMKFPPVRVKNVYILPGIPEYLRRKFTHMRERFRGEPFKKKCVYINEEECRIAESLDRVSLGFTDVAIGSYPKIGAPGYKVMVTLESTDSAALDSAFAALIGLLPSDAIVGIDNPPDKV